MPVYHHKDGKNAPSPHFAIRRVIRDNHAGATCWRRLSLTMPGYRRAKQYADLGVKLTTSTMNDWVHAVADKLYPHYEILGEEIRG